MIELFVPKRIGNYYLVAQRILGIDINKAYVHAAQVLCSGSKRVVEKLIHEPIDADQARPYEERVVEALVRVLKRADKSSIIKTAFNSSAVVFKELVLPFADEHKIKMVLPYEVESSLPFSLHDAIIDMIVTRSAGGQQGTTIMVAAVQKKLIEEHLALFKAAHIVPHAVTVDVFDLCALILQTPLAGSMSGVTVVIAIGSYTTKILLFHDTQLKLVRTIAKGIVTLAKAFAIQRGIPPVQALEELIRFGLERHDDQEYEQAVKKAVADFWQTVQFTLQSFESQQIAQGIERIILMGSGAEIAGMQAQAGTFLNKKIMVFEPHMLLQHGVVSVLQGQKIDQASLISLATALDSPMTRDVNLAQDDLAPSSLGRFAIQLITTAVLAIGLLVGLAAFIYMQTRTVARTVRSSENEVMKTLSSLNLSDARSLKEALSEAEAKVVKEEELWFGFSRQTRFSFLQALQELSAAIDRQAVGLKVKRMVITANSLLLEGEVKDFNALKILERELRESGLFILVPALQELKINEKLFFKKNGVMH
jgi:Tfp pilus assembly PilM family ATPase